MATGSLAHIGARAAIGAVMTQRIHWLMIVTFAFATTAAVPAQDRPDTAPSGTVTVTGCVQRIDDSGSLGTTIPERTPTPEQAGVVANRGEPGPGFMLTDATAATDKGAARGNASSLPRVRYILVGDEADLATYLGQRVRAQGTLAALPTKPAETGPVGTSGSTELQSNTRRLKVVSVERVAADCK
jgi:hypothetical protein